MYQPVLICVHLYLVTMCAVLTSADLDLVILHTNDMHGRFEETSQSSGTCKEAAANSNSCYGGFARVAHVVRAHRNESSRNPAGPATLFLNAGDTYTGTSWFTVHKWKIAVDFINRLQPDCISFGNHEFDYGSPGVVPFLDNLAVPLVAANMDFSNDKQFTSKVPPKSIILTVRNMRIGVIGYLLPDTEILASTGNITFFDEVKSINEESRKLDEQGVNVIIALGHSGFETDKRIAKDCPLVDVVVGGHTNTFLWNGKQPDVEEPEGPYPFLMTQSSGKVVPVVQAYAYTKYIGRLNITINEAGEVIKYEGQPILLDAKVPQEVDIDRALDVYRPGLDAATKRVIGKSKVNLLIDKCRTSECNFGNLLADAYIEHQVRNYAGNYWTDTAVVFLNGGGMRSSLEIGEITKGDVLGALPYDMNVVAFQLTGADLKEALETSIRSNGETSRGEFLQVSGLHITYDLSKAVGSRVTKVDVRCAACKVPIFEPLDMKKNYRVVSNAFLLNGGDGFAVLKEKAANRSVQDINEIEILANYIETRQIVYPDVNGRITILNDDKNPSQISAATNINERSKWFYVLILTVVSLAIA